MTLTRKDLGATLVTALAVGVYFANDYAWNIPLVGDSNRWAIAAVGILGVVGCSLGSPAKDSMSMVLGGIGIAALVVAVVGLVTGSQAMLGLLTLLVVALWLLSTVRHAVHLPHRHAPA